MVQSPKSGSHDAELALLVTLPPWVTENLERRYLLHAVHAEVDPVAALRACGGSIRGAITGGMAGLPRAWLDLMPALEICAINGVGLETTDLAACRERGVVVTTAPVLFEDVADLAVALALAACRRIPHAHRFVAEGSWLRERMVPGRRFSGKRAGLIGLGRIGMELVRRLEGFSMRIAYVDPIARDVPHERVADAVTLAENSDILFLCAAGGPRGTEKPIIGRDVIDALGPRGLFVNVARGWLVDEPALVAALQEGRLGAAALDVFDDEPNVPEALLRLPNVVLTPHIASYTEETQRAMGECVIANIDSWFAGNGPLTPAGGTERSARRTRGETTSL